MDFETLLGQLETSRPDLSESVALIRQYNKQKKENAEGSIGADARRDKDEKERLLAMLDRQSRINKKLLQQCQQLETNYALLIKHLDQLAEAAGACPQCWGEDTQCGHCRGRGKPGYYQPDSRYFDYYIRPVLTKLKLKKTETIS